MYNISNYVLDDFKRGSMKNKLIILLISVCMISGSFLAAFAADGDNSVVNYNKKYLSDYSTVTGIGDDNFNPGEFTVDMAINSIDWLGIRVPKSGSVKIKTGADKIKLSEVLPNVNKMAVAEELAMTSMAGNTFTCRNQPLEWNGKTGQWETVFNDPTGRIKTALDSLKDYIKATTPQKRGDDAIGDWFDNYINIPAGTSLQFGKTGIRFDKACEIDELYDEVQQTDQSESLFAENIYKIKTSISEFDAAENAIHIDLPSGTILQFGGSRFTLTQDLAISITGVDTGAADPVAAVISAVDTSEKTSQRYYDNKNKRVNSHKDMYSDAGDLHPGREYFIHNCDANAVFRSGFSLLNEIIGVLAEKDARIVIVSDGAYPADAQISEVDPNASICAEFTVSSAAEAEKACTHSNTRIEGKMDPTFRTVGYTGDVVCADCGKVIKEGTMIPKKPSSIQLNATSLKLKVKQSSSALKVTYVNGDSIKSVTSSKTKVIQASQSGTNKIKLKAGKKPGKAVVTVVLASGKKASINVTVQKGAVKCTGIKVTNGTKVNLKKGKTYTIKAERKPITCVQKITYKSSNKKVATVTSKGKVKAKKKGSATIRIKCGSKTKKVKITVK